MTQQPETLAPNALIDYNNDINNINDNNLDDFFHDEQDFQQQEQRVVPAKLTADGISVTYSAPPLPSSPSPVMPSPIVPARQSSVWYWDYGPVGSCSPTSSVPLTWSSTSFRSSPDGARTPASRLTFCDGTSPRGEITIDSHVDFSPQVIIDNDDDGESTSPTYSVIYDDDGNRINLAAKSSTLSPDCDRISCKRDYYEEAEDDYPSSWDHDGEVYFEDSNPDIWQQGHQVQPHQQPVQQQSQERVTKVEKKKENKASRSMLIHSANAWSDIGTNIGSSVELLRGKDRFRPKRPNRAFGRSGSKCASDSNIQDAVEMMEPGLRKIRKDSYHTTTTTCSSAEHSQNQLEPVYQEISENEGHYYGFQEHPESVYHAVLRKVAEEGYFYNCNYHYEPVYQEISEEESYYAHLNRLEPVYPEQVKDGRPEMADESGFFSWQTGNRHVTKIPVNRFPDDAEDASDGSSGVGVVTVNGRRFDCDVLTPATSDASSTTVRRDADLTFLLA